MPIFHRDTLYGVLILGSRKVGDIYSNQDLQIVATVGQQAALSIANIILVEELRGLAQQLVRTDEEQRKKLPAICTIRYYRTSTLLNSDWPN